LTGTGPREIKHRKQGGKFIVSAMVYFNVFFRVFKYSILFIERGRSMKTIAEVLAVGLSRQLYGLTMPSERGDGVALILWFIPLIMPL
jgi:hypothetical protein